MAAGGYKEFVAGETLDQDEINDFLMQGMLVFAGTAARGSAIGTPVEGQFSFLKDSDTVEFFDGSQWTGLASGFAIQAITIGGGGGGGSRFGGGGGAGAYIEELIDGVAGTYTVTVGAGGAGGVTSGGPGTSGAGDGSNGVSSVFSSSTAVGGGGGGAGDSRNGVAGASGGGGAGRFAASGGSGTANVGKDGGNTTGATTGSVYYGGGGGALGGRGFTGDTSASNKPTSGDGADGPISRITGSPVARAGGGGGGSNSATGTQRGDGGAGGGGDGGSQASINGVNATANTGSGGGGGGYSPNGLGGNGGSGVVILSIPTNVSVSFSGGVTQSSAVVGDRTVYTVTATSTTSETVTIG